jgi:hypothetical protein
MPSPSTEGFGTREFVFLLAKALREYTRNQITIDPDLDTGVKAALAVLIAALAVLEALNPPGPE